VLKVKSYSIAAKPVGFQVGPLKGDEGFQVGRVKGCNWLQVACIKVPQPHSDDSKVPGRSC